MNRVLKESEHVRATDYYINNDGGESHIQLNELGRLAGGFKGDVFRPVTEPMTFDIVASSEPLDATEEFHSSKGDLLHPKVDDSQDKPVTDEEWVDGLPPVAIECEVYHYDEWVTGYVVGANFSGHIVMQLIQRPADSYYQFERDRKLFRPIRTEAQLAEEERKAEVDKMVEICRSISGTNAKCEAVYDAGYRLTK